ncbi:MAG: cobalamin biosynthesis protein [Beijerinckiaceae bacterium]|nr:cobalamin biosynthesis protein [Beijerinckiaceae bacterium]
MGGDQAVIAIGVGCRSGCDADEIVALVEDTLAMLPTRRKALGLYSIDARRGEAGLADAASRLGLPLVFLAAEALQRFSDGAQTISPRVDRIHGLPSVAETAALAGVGDDAVLLVTRRASARATCAIAGRPL